MSKQPKQPVAPVLKSKKIKNVKWITPLSEDDPRQLIMTLFEENDKLRRDLDQIKKVNYAIKREMEELTTRLIEERFSNLYPNSDDEPHQSMELDNN